MVWPQPDRYSWSVPLHDSTLPLSYSPALDSSGTRITSSSRNWSLFKCPHVARSSSPYVLLLDLASIFSGTPLGESSSINAEVETSLLLLNNVSAPVDCSVSPQEGVTVQDVKPQSPSALLVAPESCLISSPLFSFHVQPTLTSNLAV